MAKQRSLMRSYLFSIILLISILLGGLTGYLLGQDAQYLKPFGDIFLNLIFTSIVPLVFFSVSSAIARAGTLGKIGKIMSSMIVVFLLMGTVAAAYEILIVTIFPPAQGVQLTLTMPENLTPIHFSDQIATIFTVPEFAKLLSHKNMLALILFAILVGLAAAKPHAKEKSFAQFLQTCETIFMRVFSLIMYYAPIGFFCYFAALVSELGPELMHHYVQVAVIYYVSVLIYFIIAYTCYAYLAGGLTGIKLFWTNIFLPMITAFATCSSAASIPANLVATKAMRVTPEIYESVIPLGTIIHKEGSIIGGIIKIAFLFGLFHFDFSGTLVLLTALGISLLVGTVMGAIPSGGMLGELLILSVYGFPPSVLIAVAAISIIIDPLATMLNVTGNSVGCLMIARLVEGKNWLAQQKPDGND